MFLPPEVAYFRVVVAVVGTNRFEPLSPPGGEAKTESQAELSGHVIKVPSDFYLLGNI